MQVHRGVGFNHQPQKHQGLRLVSPLSCSQAKSPGTRSAVERIRTSTPTIGAAPSQDAVYYQFHHDGVKDCLKSRSNIQYKALDMGQMRQVNGTVSVGPLGIEPSSSALQADAESPD